MTELRAKAIKELEKVSEEHVAEVIDFMSKLQEKEKETALKESQEAFEDLKKYFKRVPEDFDYKNE